MEGSGQLQDPVALPEDKNPEYPLNRRMQEGNTTACVDAVRTTIRRAELERVSNSVRSESKSVKSTY